MPLELRSTLMPVSPVATEVGYVQLFAGDHATPDQSQEWISARVKVDETNVKSLALLQIAALVKVRDLLTAESERLGTLYRQSEKAQR
jgi:hypothetical protein